jgi:hypothetical protein
LTHFLTYLLQRLHRIKTHGGVWLMVTCLVTSYSVQAQERKDSTFHKKRFIFLMGSSGSLYTAGMVGLGQLWYKEQMTGRFTFFNDNGEWHYIDKMGHFFTAFHVSDAAVQLLQWSGCDRKKSIWYGGFTGAALMIPIEVFDGFSAEYGASWGDLTANTLGSIAVTAQHLLWDEIRIRPKFSYHATAFAALRPNTLGSSPGERLLKDYNGQTHWLSFNIASLTHSRTIPQWLNISIGYSANEMVYALPSENRAQGYHSYARGFLSLDVELTRIKTKSKFLNTILYGINIIHVPLPALEYNGREGFVFHPIYF